MTARGLHESCKGPYPGFDLKPKNASPVVNSRVRPEAEEYASKHQGSLNLFQSSYFTGNKNQTKSRCPSQASRENLVYSRQGTVSKLIHCEATPRPDTPNQSRIRPEALTIAENQKGNAMANLLCSKKPQHQHMDHPNVEEARRRNSIPNWKISTLLHHSASEPASYRPVPRVKPEAEVTAEAAKGTTMAAILGQSKSSKPAPTVFHIKKKTEPSYLWGNAVKNITKDAQMKTLLNSSNTELAVAGPVARVKREGQQISNLDKGGRMNKLIYDTSSLPTPIKPVPRCGVSKVAKKLMNQNRGTVGSILSNLASHQIVLQPGVRS